MNSLDLYVDLINNRNRRSQVIQNLKRIGNELAECECAYKKAMFQTTRKLVNEEKVTWSAAERYAHGHPDVADLRLKRDKKKNEYFSYVRESKALYQEIDIQELLLKEEYKMRIKK